MKLTTYDNCASLDVEFDGNKYRIEAWHDGEMNFAHAKENGEILGGFRTPQDKEDRWSLVDILNTTFQNFPPSFMCSFAVDKVSGDIALEQRKLL